MSDPEKKPTAPDHAATPEPAGTPEPKKGGFGAFAEVYRARWAANHPNMRPRGPATSSDGAPESPPPDSAPETKSPREPGGSRLARPED